MHYYIREKETGDWLCPDGSRVKYLSYEKVTTNAKAYTSFLEAKAAAEEQRRHGNNMDVLDETDVYKLMCFSEK